MFSPSSVFIQVLRKWPLHKGFNVPKFNLHWHILCHSRASIITMCAWITLLSHWAYFRILNPVYLKDHIKLHLFTLWFWDNAPYSWVWRRLWENMPELPVSTNIFHRLGGYAHNLWWGKNQWLGWFVRFWRVDRLSLD